MDLRVKEICREKRISLTGLADRMNISKGALSEAINGNPTVNTLQKIADALGVSLVELFEAKSATPSPATTPLPFDTQLPDIGFLEYLRAYIAENKNMRIKHAANIVGTICKHVEAYSGEVSMRTVTTAYIDGFRQYLKDAGISEASQGLYIARLNIVLAQARERAAE